MNQHREWQTAYRLLIACIERRQSHVAHWLAKSQRSSRYKRQKVHENIELDNESNNNDNAFEHRISHYITM